MLNLKFLYDVNHQKNFGSDLRQVYVMNKLYSKFFESKVSSEK